MALRSLTNPVKAALNLCVFNSHAETCALAGLRGSVGVRGYAKKVAAKGKGKGMMKDVQKGPEVCKDPEKLVSHAVGVNIFKQGEDPPIKPKDEYPEWLFQLNLGPAKKLEEMDSESHEYWKRLRKENIWRFNRLHKGKKF
ncbi:39S ribosomal protein L54, mitochondrial isoform X2 [Astyanax mexicanus]|uniref:39S ribosomal protein L54, mitochondrial isoform X2 n=1 Tax=Astyanax mexicanus TaxID=7994 RepID=UPI0003CD5B4F|nr:39S ribosomal protein L54, mitochondrial isoform X2 [Astyanax mexicanus]